ncbi:MAG: glycosyltransferase [Saprospiraceae bacterium]|nr:glycosyltransferase [Saprospiraceae bacterium]
MLLYLCNLLWFVVSVVVGVLYVFLIVNYIRNWRKLPTSNLTRDTISHESAPEKITVVIPFRNEVEHLEKCLTSLQCQDLDPALWNCVLIDDHSEDDSLKIAHQFPFQVLSLPNEVQGKKNALNFAIAQASGTIIVTSDADCSYPKFWLTSIFKAYQANPHCMAMAAPVQLVSEQNSFFGMFQRLDFAGLMLITGAGFISGNGYMSNGANFSYRKSAYKAVGGFENIDQTASGDDIQLLNKFVATFGKNGVYFLKSKDAIVSTPVCNNFRSFWNQRIRWGTKNKMSSDLYLKFSLGLVYLLSFFIVANLLVGHFYLCFYLLAIKFISDYFLLKEASHFFGIKNLNLYFIPSQLFHTLYILLIGTSSIFIQRYEWKKRSQS